MSSIRRRIWDAIDDDVLRVLHGNGRSAKWIARFMCSATCTIHRRARDLGLQFDGRHRWTDADDALLRSRYPDERTVDLARDMGLSAARVSQHAAALGLHKSAAYLASPAACRLRHGDEVGKAHRFQKGQVPYNKGLRRPGWAPGRMRETQFKKGHLSGRALQIVQPIGAERVSKEGILQRKVNNDMPFWRRWKAVHVIVWESAHGPIPDGHIVLFRDHDRRNFDLTNLELVSWAENMRRNTYHRYPQPIPKLIQLRGVLNRKINKRTRKHEKQDR